MEQFLLWTKAFQLSPHLLSSTVFCGYTPQLSSPPLLCAACLLLHTHCLQNSSVWIVAYGSLYIGLLSSYVSVHLDQINPQNTAQRKHSPSPLPHTASHAHSTPTFVSPFPATCISSLLFDCLAHNQNTTSFDDQLKGWINEWNG